MALEAFTKRSQILGSFLRKAAERAGWTGVRSAAAATVSVVWATLEAERARKAVRNQLDNRALIFNTGEVLRNQHE
jgi:hypothetical protein